MDIDLVTTSQFLYHFIVYGWVLPKCTEVWKKIMLKCTPKSKMNLADVKINYTVCMHWKIWQNILGIMEGTLTFERSYFFRPKMIDLLTVSYILMHNFDL